jgi:fatty-acyl-CoA synthase
MPGLDTPLTPLSFLDRAAAVHPAKTAVIDGTRSWTHAEFDAEVIPPARALRPSGVGRGDNVAYLTSNSAEMLLQTSRFPCFVE